MGGTSNLYGMAFLFGSVYNINTDRILSLYNNDNNNTPKMVRQKQLFLM